MNRRELAAAIYRVSHRHGTFRLRSGVVSEEYFDKYQFEGAPHLLRAIGEALADLVPPGTELLAGLELGGIPLATMMSQVTGLPTAFVRKVAKEYGTGRLAEGGDVSGKQVLLVEDVMTSGGQLIESADQLRALGAHIADALCVIDREAGGAVNLAAAGIALRPLFRMRELEAAAVADA